MVKALKHQMHRPLPATIIAKAERIFDAAEFAGVNDVKASCLYWSACVVFAASTMGLRLIVQAGSASFRRLPAELDDGKPTTMTHFSYVWTDPSHADIARGLARGILPEMHVWAADPMREEIVDLTTKYLPEQCLEVAEAEWRCPKPPDRLWVPARKLPEGWAYGPNRRATELAMRLMSESAIPVIRAVL